MLFSILQILRSEEKRIILKFPEVIKKFAKMLVSFEEILDKVIQFFFHELFRKVVLFLTRFFDFLFSIVLRFNKKKKDQETFQVLYQSSNFLVVNKKHGKR